jgi:hypothetical protein
VDGDVAQAGGVPFSAATGNWLARDGNPLLVGGPFASAVLAKQIVVSRLASGKIGKRCRRHWGLEPLAEPHLLAEVRLDFCDVSVAGGDMPVTGGPEADRPPQVVGAVR